MNTKEPNQDNILCIQKEKDKREVIKRSKSIRRENFTLIDNTCLQSSKLSLQSIGLIAYLMSLPYDWIVYTSQLSKKFNLGRDSVRNLMRDLIKHGYMKRYQERNEDGRLGKWVTIFSDTPEFLASSPETEKPAPVNPGPVLPGPVESALQINNNTKETNNKETTQQEVTSIHEPGVVVSLMEKLKEIVVSKVLVKRWLKQHGAEYVMEKVDYTLSASRINPAAFLNLAVRENWKAPLGNPSLTLKKLPEEPVWPSNEENIKWYSALSNEDKKACFEFSLTKHAQFGNILDLNGISFLGQDFINSTWFKMMMSLIGRAK